MQPTEPSFMDIYSRISEMYSFCNLSIMTFRICCSGGSDWIHVGISSSEGCKFILLWLWHANQEYNDHDNSEQVKDKVKRQR